MSLEVIMEVVNDKLIHKTLFDPTVKFISEMPIITMDLVKSVVEEVNIHEESPYVFADVFNIYDNKEDLVNVYFIINGEKKLFKEFCYVNPSYFTNYSLGKPFTINDWKLGTIAAIASNTNFSVKTTKMSIIENSTDDDDLHSMYHGTSLEFFKIFSDKAIIKERVDEELSFEYTAKEMPSMTLEIVLEPAVKKHKSFTTFSS
jgi:DNA-directed RNA polymerase beta subunit